MTLDIGEAQPTYQTIDPVTFVVGADFSGHVHAGGLDLDAGTASTPPAQDRIRWLRTSDGAVVADIQVWEAAGNDVIIVESTPTSAANSAIAELVANGVGGFNGALLEILGAGPPQATAQVQAQTGGHTFIIIRDDGTSGFVQAGSPPQIYRLNAGFGGFVGGGGAPQAVSQAHSLGTNNIAFWTIVPFNWDVAGTAGQPIQVVSNTAANLNFNAWRSGGGFTLGTTYNYFWVAIANSF